MTFSLRLTRLLLLVPALAAFASASPANSLFVRDSQCAAGLESCPASLPDNFCCSQGTTCLPLAGNTTALCCPTGQNCEKIQPIACDLSLQDPSKNSQSPIKTSVFDVALEKCGANLCCPFGFSCAGGSQCQKNADQSTSPQSAGSSSSSATGSPTATSPKSPASATSPPATSIVIVPANTAPATASMEESSFPSTTSSPDPPTTSSSDPSNTPSPDSSSTETASPAPKASNPKTISIVAGVVGGCAVLAALGIIALLFVRRRNRYSNGDYHEKASIKHLGPGPGPDFPGGSIISDPILQPNSYRADFIRKSPSIGSSISQRPPRISYPDGHSQRFSIPNPFESPHTSLHSHSQFNPSVCSDDDLNARTGVVESGSGSRLAPIRAMRASSTRLSPQLVPGEPSGSESINVFADPVMVRGNYDKRQTQGTTFTDLMLEADLDDVRRGHPYLVHDPMPTNRI
ncbi:hypothetical protein ACQKWADRAFT_8944 [Trichoderma austrokoningii]